MLSIRRSSPPSYHSKPRRVTERDELTRPEPRLKDRGPQVRSKLGVYKEIGLATVSVAVVARCQSAPTASHAAHNHRHGEDARASRREHAPTFPEPLVRISDVLEGIGMHNEVEGVCGIRKLCHVAVRVSPQDMPRQA